MIPNVLVWLGIVNKLCKNVSELSSVARVLQERERVVKCCTCARLKTKDMTTWYQSKVEQQRNHIANTQGNIPQDAASK